MFCRMRMFSGRKCMFHGMSCCTCWLWHGGTSCECLKLPFTHFVLAALLSFRIGVVMTLEDCLEAFCDCLCDAKGLRKLNFVFEGSTRVSASFCRVLHCLAVLQNGIHSSVQCSACPRDQKRLRLGSSEEETAARALLFTRRGQALHTSCRLRGPTALVRLRCFQSATSPAAARDAFGGLLRGIPARQFHFGIASISHSKTPMDLHSPPKSNFWILDPSGRVRPLRALGKPASL